MGTPAAWSSATGALLDLELAARLKQDTMVRCKIQAERTVPITA